MSQLQTSNQSPRIDHRGMSAIVAPFQPGQSRLVARGFNRFGSERPEWYKRPASGLYSWFLTDLCSVHDFLSSLHDLMEQPALLGRPDSTGLGKTIVAERTVEGLNSPW
jgi:hypothetical protein